MIGPEPGVNCSRFVSVLLHAACNVSPSILCMHRPASLTLRCAWTALRVRAPEGQVMPLHLQLLMCDLMLTGANTPWPAVMDKVIKNVHATHVAAVSDRPEMVALWGRGCRLDVCAFTVDTLSAVPLRGSCGKLKAGAWLDCRPRGLVLHSLVWRQQEHSELRHQGRHPQVHQRLACHRMVPCQPVMRCQPGSCRHLWPTPRPTAYLTGPGLQRRRRCAC